MDSHSQSECVGNDKPGSDMKTCNPHLKNMSKDKLHHLALTTDDNLKKNFNDVKFVVVGASQTCMKKFADHMVKELNFNIPTGQALKNIAQGSDRYVMYKVDKIIIASHGIGVPSVSILMHELIKLLQYAECKDVTFFRMGVCSGLGVEKGTCIISETIVDCLHRPYLKMAVLDKWVEMSSELDKDLAKEVAECARETDDFKTILAKTMCTSDYYEGQARMDGAFCEYTVDKQREFLQSCYKEGIRNIDLESLGFAALCHRAGIKGAVVSVTDVNCMDDNDIARCLGDKWNDTPAKIISRWILKKMVVNED